MFLVIEKRSEPHGYLGGTLYKKETKNKAKEEKIDLWQMYDINFCYTHNWQFIRYI